MRCDEVISLLNIIKKFGIYPLGFYLKFIQNETLKGEFH